MQIIKAAGALAGILLLAVSAQASSWATTEPAVGNCVPYFFGDHGGFDGIASHNWGVVNYGSASVALTCPITSQLGLVDASMLDGVQIVGYDGHSEKSIDGSLCISNPTTGSVSCGASKSTGASVVGATAMYATAPTGTFPSYYTASIYVRLPQEQCVDSGILGCSDYRSSIVRSYNIWRD